MSSSISTLIRYLKQKAEYSLLVSYKNYEIGRVTDRQLNAFLWKNVFQGKLTYLQYNKGEQMAPTLSGQGGLLLIRRIPYVDTKNVFVNDVVALRDPQDSKKGIIRRLAAVEGDDMVSTDENDEPFILDKNECWMTSDNTSLNVQDAADSRLFGPVPLTDIYGRVLYSMQSAVEHGPVRNSEKAMQMDSAVLAYELDIDEMTRNLGA